MSDQEEEDDRSQQEEEDDQSNGRQPSDDDEGEDISAERRRGKKGGNDDDDSSEEEEDDPEEARRIAEGFIVDEDDDEDRKRRKKGKKKKRRREHSRASSPDALSEDDLDLLAENTGASRPSTSKPSTSKPKKLLRRRRSNSIPSSLDSDGSDEAALPNVNDLARIFEDLPRKRREAAMMDDDDNEDDMGDFIEEDEDPNADKEGGDKERKKREKERKRRRKEKAAGLGGVKRGGEGGIDKAAWDDIYDVFGNGDDYDWALEGEEEMMGGAVDGEDIKMEDVFEPSEIQARHLTESDTLIRVRDIPERHQLLNSTLSSHPSYVPDPFPAFPPTGPAALWISSRISPRTKAMFYPSYSAPSYDYNFRPRQDLLPRFLRSIEKSLEFMFADQMEVPFVWEHRRDYLVYWISEENKDAPEGEKINLLERDEVWRVYELGVRYRTLMERKAGLVDVWRRLSPRLAGQEAEEEAEDSDGMDIEDEEGGDGRKEKKRDPRRVYFESQVISSGGTAEESVEGVVDGMEWLASRYAREVKEMREEEAEMQVEGKDRVYKKHSSESGLDVLRQSRLSRFIKDAGIPVEEVVSVNFSGNNVAFQEDPEFLPEVYAEQFTIAPKEVYDNSSEKFHTIDGPLPTVEKVLGAARSILSQDMYKNPTLRKLIRSLFRDRGLVTVVPTERGITQIDDYHPFFPFKYTKDKPIAGLIYSPRFLLMLEAEKESLVTLKFSLPATAISQLEEQIYSAYKSDSFSAKAEAWNAFRRSVVTSAVKHGLVPVGAAWVKEWLRAEVEDFVARSCGTALELAANQSPFQPRSHDKGDSPSVLAVSHGMGDRAKDAVMCVYLDEEGRVRETIKVDTLFEDRDAAFKTDEDADAPRKTTPIDEFKALLSRRKPSLIVMGGFSVATSHLTSRVRSIVEEMAQSIAQDNLRYDAPEEDRIREIEEAKTPVIYVPDNVARIYMHSVRAQKDFATLPPTGRYCVGLGRYAQSPIHEFCALGTDITAITFEPEAQKLVPREKLLIALERALVNVVNDVGVLINDVVSDTYMQYVLPFISGFGPRKAAQLIKDIVKSGGALTNRMELMSLKLLDNAMFDNAAAFLEIKSDPEDLELSGEDVASQLDPLDNTRIHPADYEFARKMAENALELDEEDVTDDHPSKSVVRLMNDESNAEKLSELNLDDFAENLREIRNVEKRYALEVIKDEILAPGKDRRQDFHLPTAWEILTMLSGETPATLKQGLLVAGRIYLVRDTETIVQLASGIEGIIELGFISDEINQIQRCGEVVTKGTTVQATIIEVKPEDLKVKLSLRGQDIRHALETEKPKLEEPYDHQLVEAHKEAALHKKRKEGGAIKRQIDHPNFFNMNAGQAEQMLASQQRGDVVIRPSSKGPNHLAVTWKVDEGIYQHLDVEELGEKVNQASLAPILRVSGKYTYHDLDELIVNHVKATVHSLEELMKSDKFKGKTSEELDSFLKTFVLAHPGKSIYAFGLDRKRAGYFVLAFLNKSTTEGGVIQRWPVKVNPGSYQLSDAEVPGVLELCNAFKLQYQARTASMPQGGRTPHRGGATPAYGGRTPGGRTPGGRTFGVAPNGSVYLPNGERAPMQYVPTGATPNPYAPTGATPYGAGGAGGRTPYGEPSMAYPVAQQQQPYGQQPYGQQPGFGGYPQQQQPQGGFPPQQQQQQPFPGAGLPSNPTGPAGPSINPARAAMMGRGGGAAGGGY